MLLVKMENILVCCMYKLVQNGLALLSLPVSLPKWKNNAPTAQIFKEFGVKLDVNISQLS
jgi:hypothetical protein